MFMQRILRGGANLAGVDFTVVFQTCQDEAGFMIVCQGVPARLRSIRICFTGLFLDIGSLKLEGCSQTWKVLERRIRQNMEVPLHYSLFSFKSRNRCDKYPATRLWSSVRSPWLLVLMLLQYSFLMHKCMSQKLSWMGFSWGGNLLL